MLFTHPDGEAAKLPEAEVRSTRASSEKLNAANKTFSFFDLRILNFSMIILTIDSSEQNFLVCTVEFLRRLS